MASGLFWAGNRRDTAISWLFVGVQAVLLLALVLLPGDDLWTVPAWLDAAARVLQLVGLVVLGLGLVNLGRSLTALPSPVPGGELKTGGLYRFVRHPIYSGILALAIGSAVRSGSAWIVAVAAGLTGWFMLKARWEEARLAERYEGYEAYAARTPRFVPGWPAPRRPPGR